MTAPASAPTRRRPPPRPVEVVEVTRPAPRIVAVTVAGPSLADYPVPPPTAHLKVFLPQPGQLAPTLPVVGDQGWDWPADQPRPTVRTYTPRSFDPATGALQILFFLHGEGPASTWAEQVQPGHQLAVGNPGARFNPDPEVAQWWIGGDESAIPAIAMLLESLPPDANGDVHIEIADTDSQLPLTAPDGLRVHWHERGMARFGAALAAHEPMLTAPGLIGPTNIWLACEASAMRGMRPGLLTMRTPGAGSLTTRGYWRLGEQNHPDHDYGED